MTVKQSSEGTGGSTAGDGIVLVALGGGGPQGSPDLPPLEELGAGLANRLGVPLLPLVATGTAHGQLAALVATAAAHPAGWFAALAVDVGRPLAEGGSWAQVLGAWRQPVLLVVPAPLQESGQAAAGAALLERSGVPLVGLLQWGGVWDPPARRADGLPWLGVLARAEPPLEGGDRSLREEGEEGLEAALRLRLLRLRG